jgi:hypothetical protein
MKIKQASGFAEEVIHIETAFVETPLGHRFLYDEIARTLKERSTRNYELRTRN